MNLLLLDQFSDLGGAQQVLAELLPAIRDRRWRTLVGLPGLGKLFESVRAQGFETEAIECGPYASGTKSAVDMARFLAATPRLAKQIRCMAQRVDAELVYLNGPRLLPAAALAGLQCPVLFHTHSYISSRSSRAAAGFALRHMDSGIVAACEFVAAQWRPFVPPDRVSVIYNGVAGPASLTPKQANGPPRIGCIGRIAPEKGQREFVAAAARIHESLPDCRFIIYGAPLFEDAEAERYYAEVRKAGETACPTPNSQGLQPAGNLVVETAAVTLNSQTLVDACGAGLQPASNLLEFRGWVTDVYSAMSELDLLLVPSVGPEATTRVILEAFAAGVPVIAFPSGGIPEVISHGVNGFLAQSVEEMAQLAIALLTGDTERLHSITTAAHASWQQRFTLQRFHDQILNVMEHVSHAGPAPPPAHAAGSRRC